MDPIAFVIAQHASRRALEGAGPATQRRPKRTARSSASGRSSSNSSRSAIPYAPTRGISGLRVARERSTAPRCSAASANPRRS